MLDKDYLNSVNVTLSSRCPKCGASQSHSVRANNSGDLVCGSCGHKYQQAEARPVFADGGLTLKGLDNLCHPFRVMECMWRFIPGVLPQAKLFHAVGVNAFVRWGETLC